MSSIGGHSGICVYMIYIHIHIIETPNQQTYLNAHLRFFTILNFIRIIENPDSHKRRTIKLYPLPTKEIKKSSMKRAMDV